MEGKKIEHENGIMVLSHYYIYDLFISSINPQMFVYDYSKEYELVVVNEKGDVLI